MKLPGGWRWPAGWTTGRLIAGIAVWAAISTAFVLTIALLSGKPVFRAEILMGTGLVVLWILVAGAVMWRLRDRVRQWVLSIPVRWQVKFVLFCTVLALTEEAITVTMTNLAPVFGVPIGKAYITASTNYLDVVCLHSVVVFVPLFVGWAWILARWDFHPNAVLLVFGITGMLAEVSFSGPQALAEFGMWIFVYGLMVYLPAYCLPRRERAMPPLWWHYPMAVFLPVVFAMPVAAVVGFLHPIRVHFPPMNPNG